jgi:hypothetical protein
MPLSGFINYEENLGLNEWASAILGGLQVQELRR